MINITEILSREHQVVLRMLAEFADALERYDVPAIRRTIQFFDEQLVLHRRKEEEVLFPELGKHIGTAIGPIHCMLEEHAEEKKMLGVLREGIEAGDTDRVLEAGRFIINFLQAHIYKEDNVLFPLAERMLTDAQKAEMKGAMNAIGACCPECAHHS